MKNLLLLLICTMLFVGLVNCRIDQQETEEVANELYPDYAGSAACSGCHSGIYGKFTNSGHPYKLNKVIDGNAPTYPFTTLPVIPNAIGLKDGDNTLGPPQSYSDVSYVIGGYNWKARYIDVDGFIVTGSDTQYNFETGGWVAYSDGQVDKPYDCGKCHTTGWIPYEDGGLRQDDLPGMDGTFFKGGIHCEECHGPAADHVANSGGKETVTIDASSKACGKCHTRDSENRIAAKGGYIKHHEQYDELLGKDPDTMQDLGKHLIAGIGCNQCHDPHSTTVNMEKTGDPGVKTSCIDCHSDRIITKGRMAGMDCLECHMPKLSKSAVGHAGEGTGPDTGDIKTHIFKINLLKSDSQQFTPSGSFAYPWLTGKTACKHCHNGVEAFDINFPSGIKIHKTDSVVLK